MVDAVNIAGGTQALAPVGQSGGQFHAASADGAARTAEPTAAGLLSSRLYVDPTAGGILVTEQIASDGSIAQQVPSASVLAYLRNGLTIEGYPKQSTTA